MTPKNEELIRKAVLGEIDESQTLEFKPHFGHPSPADFKTKEEGKTVYRVAKDIFFNDESSLQKYFEFQSIRAVCSFLNSEGGKLVIGIADAVNKNGTRDVYGLIDKTAKSEDQFKLDVSAAIEKKISKPLFSKFISIDCVQRGTNKVCVITVKKYNGPKKQIFVETYSTPTKRAYQALFLRPANKTIELNDPVSIFEHGLEVAGIQFEKTDVNQNLRQAPNLYSLPFAKYGWNPKVKLLSVYHHDYEGAVLVLAGEGIALAGDPWNPSFKNEYKEFESFIGNYIHISPSPFSNPTDSTIQSDRVHLAVDEEFGLQTDRTVIKWSEIIDIKICPPRTIRRYWDRPEGAFKIITDDEVFFTFSLPDDFIGRLVAISGSNDAEEWEHGDFLSVIAEKGERDDHERIEALVVPFEDIKIATLYEAIAIVPGNFSYF